MLTLLGIVVTIAVSVGIVILFIGLIGAMLAGAAIVLTDVIVAALPLIVLYLVVKWWREESTKGGR